MSAPPLPASIAAHPTLGDWLRLRDDGGFEALSGKVELGQGISAALISIVCKGLGVDPDQVRLVAGDTALCPDEGYTAGSQSIEVGGAALRHACDAMRRLGAAAAVQRLGVSVGSLQVERGRFTTAKDAPGVDYHQLASGRDWPTHRLDSGAGDDGVDAIVQPREEAVFARTDLLAKLTGAGAGAGSGFVQDLVLEGMLHARVVRGAHPSSRARDVDETALRALDGVLACVRQGDFLALVGHDESRLVAAAATARQSIAWELPPLPPYGDIEVLLTGLPAVSSLAHAAGVAEQAVEGAAPVEGEHRLRRRYSRPYIAHAAIGTSCAVATPASPTAADPCRLTVWSHTQGAFKLRDQIAEALGLAPAEVRVIHMAGSGCYGHNGADDVAFDAALLALTLNAPVRVQWSREDEMTVAPMGSASLIELEATLDAHGAITRWQSQVWSHSHLTRPGAGSGIQLLGAWALRPDEPRPTPVDVPLPTGGGLRNAIPYYTLPALEVRHHFVAEAPVRTSALRSLGAHANVFAIESFMDELADAAGLDPVEFRLRHLADERARHVCEVAARLARWSDRPAGGEGQGFGFAFSRYKNRAGYLAVVIEVEVGAAVQVTRVWAVVDAGSVVHRDGLMNQIEGGIVQALSWSLKESVRWGPQGVLTSTWDEYPILGFTELPEVVIELVDRPDQPSLGAGELAPGPVAGALGNAVAHALGLRARHLPFTPERLLALINTADEDSPLPA